MPLDENCGCTEITTNPCTAETGCTITSYAKCIVYSGNNLTCSGVLKGDTLEQALTKIDSQICAIGGLNYSSFNYYCVKDTTGASITTAQEFVEGISKAHCDLEDRVELVEKPSFTRCSLFTSGTYLITPGTTTLQEILRMYGELLCNLSTNDSETITVPVYCFSSNAGIDTLEGYLTWIVENTCNIKTSLTSLITANTTSITNLKNYLGTTSEIASKHNNSSSCIAGGATDTVYTTIELIKTKLCSLNTTVSALPDLNNITLSYSPCYVFTPTATLTTHLNNIVATLKLQKYNFSSDFTVSTGSCGSTISLAAGVGAFSCSNLSSCSIHNLGDVVDTLPVSGDCGKKLGWNSGTSRYELMSDITLSSSGIVTNTGMHAADPIGFIVKPTNTAGCPPVAGYDIKFVNSQWVDLGAYFTAALSVVGSRAHMRKSWEGKFEFKGVISSLGPFAVGNSLQPFANTNATGLGALIMTGLPSYLRPTTYDFKMDVFVDYPRVVSPGQYHQPTPGYLTVTTSGDVYLYCYSDDYMTANFGSGIYSGMYSLSLSGLNFYE